MFKDYPTIGKPLTKEHIELITAFTKSCRKSIIEMVANAQSGHPGGSLSTLDYLATLYAFILSQTGEKIVISNGHISPAVYSILAELNYIPKNEVINSFRQFGSKFEGHVSRHVNGIFYGTGPLGIGTSVASAFALAKKMKGLNEKTFATVGDGEIQEGQIHEMIHFSRHYKLNNLILFVDYNKVQLTASIEKTLNIDIPKVFEAGHWHIIKTDGHDFEKIWNAISEAYTIKDKPVVILGDTIMGKGVDFMEVDGKNLNSTWHGKPPTKEQISSAVKKLTLTKEEENLLNEFRKTIKWKPTPTVFEKSLTPLKINEGSTIEYNTQEQTDCRTAYGKALVDLASQNKKIIALTADLKSSVMTKFVSENHPEQYVECGITEQHMVSLAGGLSLEDYVPFCSTFGAFMSSRAKDQARLNDINQTNVKMVATHCGLSVGEDGPTHQAIDDAGSFLGLFNTMVIEPIDPNHTDRIIRYIASHYGNFYVRMGRSKVPTLTKENGEIFYDKNYKYEYGKCDLVREGKDITIAACGATVFEAIKAREELKDKFSIEIIAVSSIKKFDKTLIDSIKKTKNLITIEDHTTFSGLGSQLSLYLANEKITINSFKSLGVNTYQLSGKPEKLYHSAKIDSSAIIETIKTIPNNNPA